MVSRWRIYRGMSARLSRKAAVHYWDRFCLFIAFIDGLGPNDCSSVWDYLAIENVERFFSHLGEGIEKKGGKKEPASSGWLDTVKRTINSFPYCFVWPYLTAEQWEVYSERMASAKAQALKAAQSMAKQKSRGDLFVPDPNRCIGFMESLNSPWPSWTRPTFPWRTVSIHRNRSSFCTLV